VRPFNSSAHDLSVARACEKLDYRGSNEKCRDRLSAAQDLINQLSNIEPKHKNNL
jgi:hypothetical protein